MATIQDIKTSSLSDNEGIPSKDTASINAVAVPIVPTQYADESYKLFSQLGEVNEPTPEEARLIRNKCIKWILPFICVGYHIMYVDKQTVSFLFEFRPETPGLTVYSLEVRLFWGY